MTRPLSPQPPVEGIRYAFTQVPLVGVGEIHWCARSLDFIIEMIASPGFETCCNDIVVEFGNARHQALVDRYVAGEDVDIDILCRVWRDTLHFMLWSPEVYARFFQRIREINAHLPPSRRLRVILGEEACDWRSLTFTEWKRLHQRRDEHYRIVVEKEVLARKRRALLVFGVTHLLKHGNPAMMSANGPAAPLGAQLIEHHGDILRVIWPYFMAKADFLTSTEQAAWPIPSITWLDSTELADREFIPPFATQPEARIKAGDAFDACLYLGNLERNLNVPASVYEDQEWLDEIGRRAAILGATQRKRIESLLPEAARKRIRACAALE
ncbi:hypothetical protein [Phytohalomonas tamaricis]|uniref:hypothetical protein n=1 Tax=Phytohalomonas tamaricis TaxID=2081032 RepID=UPI000D0ABB84|nr:hypothetical protein [Phytohalomonas tamaricis]